MLVVTVLLATHIRAAVAAAQGLLAAFKLVLAVVLLAVLAVLVLQAALLAHLFIMLAAAAVLHLVLLALRVAQGAMAVVRRGAMLLHLELTQLLILVVVVVDVLMVEQLLTAVLVGQVLLSFHFQARQPQPLGLRQ